MSTYAKIIKDAEKTSGPYVDDTMPKGIFGVTVKNIGSLQTYFFRGDNGQADAPVVGRIQMTGTKNYYYRGGGMMGGRFVFTSDQIFA